MPDQISNDDAPRVDLQSALSSSLENVDITTPEVSTQTPPPETVQVPAADPAAAQTPPVAQPQTPPAQVQPPATQVPGQQAPVAQPAPTFANNRDFAARALGMTQAMNFADDQQFTQAMVQSWSQMQQQNRQMAGELQALRAQVTPPAAAPAPTAASPAAPDPLERYKAPEWNPEWARMVDRLEGGGFRAREGHEAVLPKFQAAQAWRDKFASDFLTDPRGALSPLIQHEARTIAAEIVQQQLAEREQKQYVDSFVKDNSSWLLQPAPQGGQQFTPYGQKYTQYTHDVQQRLGITDPRLQQEVAGLYLARDLYWPLVQQQQAATAGAAQNAAVTAANRNPAAAAAPAPTGSLVTTQSPGTQGPAVQNDQLSLADRLRAQMAHLPEQLEVA